MEGKVARTYQLDIVELDEHDCLMLAPMSSGPLAHNGMGEIVVKSDRNAGRGGG